MRNRTETKTIPKQEYLSGSAFLANLILPNKQSFKAKWKFRSRDHDLIHKQ